MKFLFIVLLLLISIPTHDKLKIIEVSVFHTLNLIIRYEDRVHDTIPPQSLRLIGKNKIEYWNKDSVIIHIADKYDLDSIVTFRTSYTYKIL
jgi:hypothetical protein